MKDENFNSPNNLKDVWAPNKPVFQFLEMLIILQYIYIQIEGGYNNFEIYNIKYNIVILKYCSKQFWPNYLTYQPIYPSFNGNYKLENIINNHESV